MKRAFNTECVKAVAGKKAETYYYCTEFSSFCKSITCVLIGNDRKDTKENGTLFFPLSKVSFHIKLEKANFWVVPGAI